MPLDRTVIPRVKREESIVANEKHAPVRHVRRHARGPCCLPARICAWVQTTADVFHAAGLLHGFARARVLDRDGAFLTRPLCREVMVVDGDTRTIHFDGVAAFAQKATDDNALRRLWLGAHDQVPEPGWRQTP